MAMKRNETVASVELARGHAAAEAKLRAARDARAKHFAESRKALSELRALAEKLPAWERLALEAGAAKFARGDHSQVEALPVGRDKREHPQKLAAREHLEAVEPPRST